MQKILVALLSVFVGVGSGFAAGSNTATAAVNACIVNPINLGVDQQAGSITIGESGTTELGWMTYEDSHKILVRLNHIPFGIKSVKLTAGPDFFGRFAQIPVSRGEVNLLDLEDHEIAVGIRGDGGCRVVYTVIADPSHPLSAPESIALIFILADGGNRPILAEGHNIQIMPDPDLGSEGVEPATSTTKSGEGEEYIIVYE